MAKHDYIVASEEGANYAKAEIGDQVELDLSVDQQRALIAAGWVEESKTKKKES